MKINLNKYELVAGAILLHAADEEGMILLHEITAIQLRMAGFGVCPSHHDCLQTWRQFPRKLKAQMLEHWRKDILPSYRN